MDMGIHLSGKKKILFFSIYKLKIFNILYTKGTVIMVLALLMFDDAFLIIQTITFTALIIAEILNVLTSVRDIKNIYKLRTINLNFLIFVFIF